MGKYKLIALDMDGTLLNSEQEVSEENRKWIYAAMDAGVTVSFSTGRGIQHVLPYIEQLGLKTPIVAVNGSEVWKEPHVLLKRQLMDLEQIKEMYKMAVEMDTWFWAYAVEGVYNQKNWAEEIDSLLWLKFGFDTADSGKRREIEQTLQSWGTVEITNSSLTNLEINPIGISKASGVQEICRLLGIEMSEVVTMGDSLNDMAMIRAAGLGVAMGNAQDKLKEAADLVTVSNDENGVAKVIREQVLNRS